MSQATLITAHINSHLASKMPRRKRHPRGFAKHINWKRIANFQWEINSAIKEAELATATPFDLFTLIRMEEAESCL